MPMAGDVLPWLGSRIGESIILNPPEATVLLHFPGEWEASLGRGPWKALAIQSRSVEMVVILSTH